MPVVIAGTASEVLMVTFAAGFLMVTLADTFAAAASVVLLAVFAGTAEVDAFT
jgi:hypothetical protein